MEKQERKELKSLLQKNKDDIPSYLLLETEANKRKSRAVIAAITSKYGSEKVDYITERNPNDVIAYTNGRKIHINILNHFFQNKNFEEVLRIEQGLYSHECGHILYTAFKWEQEQYKEWEKQGKITFPASKIPFVNKKAFEKIKKSFKETPDLLETLIHSTENILEDGYIEEMLKLQYIGSIKTNLNFVKGLLVDDFDSSDEKVYENWQNILLAVVRGCLPEEKYNDLWKEARKRYQKLLSEGQNSCFETRFGYALSVLSLLWEEYIEPQIEEAKQEQQAMEELLENLSKDQLDKLKNQEQRNGMAQKPSFSLPSNLGNNSPENSNNSDSSEGSDKSGKGNSENESSENDIEENSDGSATSNSSENSEENGNSEENTGNEENDTEENTSSQSTTSNSTENSDDTENPEENGNSEENMGNEENDTEENTSSQSTTSNSTENSENSNENESEESAEENSSESKGSEEVENTENSDDSKENEVAETNETDENKTDKSNENGENSKDGENGENEEENISDQDFQNDVNQIIQEALNELVTNQPDLAKEMASRIENKGLENDSFHEGVLANIRKIENSYKDADLYKKYLEKHKIRLFSKAMQRFVKKDIFEREKGSVKHNLYSGKNLDLKSICNGSDKVFSKNKLPNKKPILCASVLIDQSGSMFGEKLEAAIVASMVLEDFCRNLKIPLSVSGHNTEYNVNLYDYINFGEEKISRAYKLVQVSADGCNRDGYAIKLITNRLVRRKESTKILFLISDGAPNHNSYGRQQLKDELKELKKIWKQKNIVFVPLCIDSDSLPYLKNIYGNSLVDATDLQKFPKLLNQLLVKEIKNQF